MNFDNGFWGGSQPKSGPEALGAPPRSLVTLSHTILRTLQQGFPGNRKFSGLNMPCPTITGRSCQVVKRHQDADRLSKVRRDLFVRERLVSASLPLSPPSLPHQRRQRRQRAQYPAGPRSQTFGTGKVDCARTMIRPETTRGTEDRVEDKLGSGRRSLAETSGSSVIGIGVPRGNPRAVRPMYAGAGRATGPRLVDLAAWEDQHTHQVLSNERRLRSLPEVTPDAYLADTEADMHTDNQPSSSSALSNVKCRQMSPRTATFIVGPTHMRILKRRHYVLDNQRFLITNSTCNSRTI
ncbi:hypothetical protein WOLCODRAFT_17781 [Wolfiporia cocos MD-104 SS10]|uniref:Uncharacterized protein n=1 Tax=Wolfiporia cocos (strain MD-104) TaxID=742152 RepID=A0A2H3JK13_WOLCO|nr:hypothetical protein WOLCODRAFT_17781 [Wolfiporia cocos MD-104 SS10]